MNTKQFILNHFCNALPKNPIKKELIKIVAKRTFIRYFTKLNIIQNM